MNSSTFISTGSRRAVYGAWLLASALLAGAAMAETQICGCEKHGKYTWSEHLTLYSNMVYYAQQARENYAQALDASREAGKVWKVLGGESDSAEKLRREIEDAGGLGRDLQSQVNSYVSKDDWKQINQLASRVEEYLNNVKDLKAAWKALDINAFTGNQGSEVRKEDNLCGEFFNFKKRFDERGFNEADNTYYTAISLPCLKREFEALKPLKKELSDAEADLRKKRDGASDLRQSLVKTGAAVEAAFKDCDAWKSGIARALGLPPDAGDKEIVEKIKTPPVVMVTVRFRNVKANIPPLELRSGIDELTPPEDPFVSDGPKFRYWKERAKDEAFREWGGKISRNLELEAVWGYEVHVAGVDAPLMFPVDRWDESLPCSRVLGSEQLKTLAEKLMASKEVGYVFKGWANANAPDEPLSSGNIKTGATIQPIWAKAIYLVTYVVPGGTPPPVEKWEYTPEGPFPSPPPLPPNANDGFSYVRWSLEPDGAEPWTGGVAITNNLTVYAVREADYRVVFHDVDGRLLKTIGVKKGEEFEIPGDIVINGFKAGKSPFDKGRVFTGQWRLQGQSADNTFNGGTISEDINVYAIYRDETTEDVINRLVAPIEKRARFEYVVVAVTALLVVFIALMLTGGGPRTPKAHDATAPAEGEGQAATSEASAPAAEGEPKAGEGANA